MPRFRARPGIEIDAIRWTGDNLDEIIEWMQTGAQQRQADSSLTFWAARSGARVRLQLGDWIIRERDGVSFYPCADREFTERWEPTVIAAGVDERQVSFYPAHVHEFRTDGAGASACLFPGCLATGPL